MIYETIHEVTDNATQIELGLITAVTTITVAIIGVFTTRRFIHPRTPKRDPDERHNGRGRRVSALASYSGDQNEFMALVIEDSKNLHSRIDRMDNQLEALKKERTQIVGAFGRYIQKLALAWGSGGKMPFPDDDDMSILEDTLPADWRRRR